MVQALPSLHGFVLFVKTHPVAGVHVSSVHTLLSLQTSVPVPGWQLPPEHVSPVVQALPSLHGFVLFVKTQPLAGLQVSVVQTLLSLQTTAVPGWQMPPAQASPAVQALLSLHDVPPGAFGLEQIPVAGLQVPATWHWSSAVQSTAVPEQVPPARHTSPVVQALLSVHDEPVAITVAAVVPGFDVQPFTVTVTL